MWKIGDRAAWVCFEQPELGFNERAISSGFAFMVALEQV